MWTHVHGHHELCVPLAKVVKDRKVAAPIPEGMMVVEDEREKK